MNKERENLTPVPNLAKPIVASNTMSIQVSPFTAAHRFYVKSLYKRFLVNSLNWTIRRDTWREHALMIRAEFERNRNVHDPRALAAILSEAEARLASFAHPDPYIVPSFPGGTKWERNPPPRLGEIYDHHNEKRDRLVRDAIKELEALGQDPRVFLESLRKDNEYVDSYLNDHPFETSKVEEAPAAH